MILDTVENASNYVSIHPLFDRAFAFLNQLNEKNLQPGRNEIDGNSLFAVVVKADGKGRSGAKLETHDKYMDIQFTVSGEDLIGYADRASCASFSEGYDAEKDLEFYSNPPGTWVKVPAGSFAVFFPGDAHAPMGTDGAVDKVVVKIAVG